MSGGGRSVLIWIRLCRTMLGDKGKHLSGDKGTRTDKHGPKKQKGKMAQVRTKVYAYGLNYEHICVQTELKYILYAQ